MKVIKSFVFVLFVCLTLSCAIVGVSRNPDFNYAPTDPRTVLIYDRFEPRYSYFIIGRISIDPNWSLSVRQIERKIQEKAALIGGDAVIITDINVNVVAFNQYQTTRGAVELSDNRLDFYAVSNRTTIPVPLTYLYGYVIKRL